MSKGVWSRLIITSFARFFFATTGKLAAGCTCRDDPRTMKRSQARVACSARAALPEVAEDAALYFDPEQVSSIAAAMRTLTGDAVLRADLVARGAARVAQFSWKRVATETLDVYRTAIDRRHA